MQKYNMSRLAKLRKLGKVPSRAKISKKPTTPTQTSTEKQPGRTRKNDVGRTSSKSMVIAITDTGKTRTTTISREEKQTYRTPKSNVKPEEIPKGYVYLEPAGAYIPTEDVKKAVLNQMAMRKYHLSYDELPKSHKEKIDFLYKKGSYQRKAAEKDIEDKIITGQEWLARYGFQGSTIKLYAPYSKNTTNSTNKQKNSVKNQAISSSQATRKGKNMPKNEENFRAYSGEVRKQDRFEGLLTKPLSDIAQQIAPKEQKKDPLSQVEQGARNLISGTLIYPAEVEFSIREIGQKLQEYNFDVVHLLKYKEPIFTTYTKETAKTTALIAGAATVGPIVGVEAGTAAVAAQAGYTAYTNPKYVQEYPIEYATTFGLGFAAVKGMEIVGKRTKINEKIKYGIEDYISKKTKYTTTFGNLDIGRDIKGKGTSTTKTKVVGPVELEIQRPYYVEYSRPVEVVRGSEKVLQVSGKMKTGEGNVKLKAFGKEIEIGKTKSNEFVFEITKKGKTIVSQSIETKTGRRTQTLSRAQVKAKEEMVFSDVYNQRGEFYATTKGGKGYIAGQHIGEKKELGVSLTKFRNLKKTAPKKIDLSEKTGIEKLWPKEEEVIKESIPYVETTSISEVAKGKIYKTSRKISEKIDSEMYKAKAKIKHTLSNIKEGAQTIQKSKEKILDIDFEKLNEIFQGEAVLTKEKPKVEIKIPKSEKVLSSVVILSIPKAKTRTKQKERIYQPQIQKQENEKIFDIDLQIPTPTQIIQPKSEQIPTQRNRQNIKPLQPFQERTRSIPDIPTVTTAPKIPNTPKNIEETGIEIPLLPPFVPSFSFAGIKNKKSKGIKMKGKYTPSLDALLFKIYGKKPKKLTGLETRPILKRGRKK